LGKKNQYLVTRYTGVPVENDGNGGYQLKLDASGQAKLHVWRTGKHTRGKYTGIGQLMLTENNLMVMIVAAEPMAFKDRHQEVPLQRFLTTTAPADLVEQGCALLKEEQ
jgi:hypothetical protein